MDSSPPPARPQRVDPAAPGYPIVELPRARRSGAPRALLAAGFVAVAAGALWVLIGMAVWRLFH